MARSPPVSSERPLCHELCHPTPRLRAEPCASSRGAIARGTREERQRVRDRLVEWPVPVPEDALRLAAVEKEVVAQDARRGAVEAGERVIGAERELQERRRPAREL